MTAITRSIGIQLKQLKDVAITSTSSGDVITASPSGTFTAAAPSGSSPTDPTFTYNGSGDLTRVDYAGGAYKTLTYDAYGVLSRVDFIQGAITTRKDFVWVGETLDHVDESVF